MPSLEARPAHSVLGASGAERWINCPGSVEIIKHLTLPQSDDEDYRINGTAAHAAGARLLCCPSLEAYELVGEKFEGVECDDEIANAVQFYADYARPLIKQAEEGSGFDGTRIMIEYPISSPIHKDFYGTCDLAVISPGAEHHGQWNLTVVDYKHGEGIAVDAEDNPQLMYYAYGVLQEHTEIDKVTLVIVQPRAFHEDGPIREWETTAAHIREWAEKTLLPAMLRTEVDNALDVGSWCRFCPAKIVCPMLNGLFRAACLANPAELVNMGDKEFGLTYQYKEGVKFYLAAMEKEGYRRLNTGHYDGGVIKLVDKKANRVYRANADILFRQKFGEDAVEKPKLKSPAEMEKISAEAKSLVREYAYTPKNGTTVALLTDKRPAVIVRPAQETFAGAVAALNGGEAPAAEVLPAPADDFDDLFAPLPVAENPDGLDVPAFMKR